MRADSLLLRCQKEKDFAASGSRREQAAARSRPEETCALAPGVLQLVAVKHTFPPEGHEAEFDKLRHLRLTRGQSVCVTAEVDEDGDGVIDWLVGYVRGGDTGHRGTRTPCPPRAAYFQEDYYYYPARHRLHGTQRLLTVTSTARARHAVPGGPARPLGQEMRCTRSCFVRGVVARRLACHVPRVAKPKS